MKLEAAAMKGKSRIELPYSIKGEKIITEDIVRELFRSRDSLAVKDSAYSAHCVIADAFAEYAIREADKRGVSAIGFTGGVAYNHIITGVIGSRILKAGYRFVLQENLPCGDGGLSFGQAYTAQMKLE